MSIDKPDDKVKKEVKLNFISDSTKIWLILLEYVLIISWLFYVSIYESRYNDDTPDYTTKFYPTDCDSFTPSNGYSYCANIFFSKCISYESVIINGTENWTP